MSSIVPACQQHTIFIHNARTRSDVARTFVWVGLDIVELRTVWRWNVSRQTICAVKIGRVILQRYHF